MESDKQVSRRVFLSGALAAGAVPVTAQSPEFLEVGRLRVRHAAFGNRVPPVQLIAVLDEPRLGLRAQNGDVLRIISTTPPNLPARINVFLSIDDRSLAAITAVDGKLLNPATSYVGRANPGDRVIKLKASGDVEPNLTLAQKHPGIVAVIDVVLEKEPMLDVTIQLDMIATTWRYLVSNPSNLMEITDLDGDIVFERAEDAQVEDITFAVFNASSVLPLTSEKAGRFQLTMTKDEKTQTLTLPIASHVSSASVGKNGEPVYLSEIFVHPE